MASQNDLSNLIQLKDIYIGENFEEKRHIFSTNVFIPQNITKIKIDLKIYSYLTGFIKLVETFERRTDGHWGLIIYIDDMFLRESPNYNNFNYKPSNNNKDYNIEIKTFFQEENNKKKIQDLLNLYRFYIDNIIQNPKLYKLIKIVSYKCPSLVKKDKYLGHPSTFGSLVRFLSLFDLKYEVVICINISNAISIVFFYHILKFIASEKLLTKIDGYIPDDSLLSDLKLSSNQNFSQKENYLKFFYPEMKQNRLLAGLLCFKPQKYEENYRKFQFTKKRLKSIKELKEEFLILIKQCIIIFSKYATSTETLKNNLINPFSYGIDEYIITNIFLNICINKEYIYLFYNFFKNPESNNNLKISKNSFGIYIFDEMTNKSLKENIDFRKRENFFKKRIFTNFLFNLHKYLSIKYLEDTLKDTFNNDVSTNNINDFLNLFYNGFADLFRLLNCLDEEKPLFIIPSKEDYDFIDFSEKSYISIYLQVIDMDTVKIDKTFIDYLISYYRNLNMNINFTNKKGKEVSINTTDWNGNKIENLDKLFIKFDFFLKGGSKYNKNNKSFIKKNLKKNNKSLKKKSK